MLQNPTFLSADTACTACAFENVSLKEKKKEIQFNLFSALHASRGKCVSWMWSFAFQLFFSCFFLLRQSYSSACVVSFFCGAGAASERWANTESFLLPSFHMEFIFCFFFPSKDFYLNMRNIVKKQLITDCWANQSDFLPSRCVRGILRVKVNWIRAGFVNEIEAATAECLFSIKTNLATIKKF